MAKKSTEKLEDKLESKGIWKSIVKKSKYLLLLAAIPFMTNCTTAYHYRPTSEPFVRPSQEINLFTYDKKPVDAKVKLVWQKEFYDVYSVNFPSFMKTDPDNDTVKAFYYKPKKEGKSAAVIILPVLRGPYVASKYFADSCARSGFAVLRYERKANLVDKSADDVDDMFAHGNIVLRQMIIDSRRGLDWLETRSEVDKDKLGLTGASLGAIVSSLLMESDSRFKAGVFFIGGGNIPEILYDTTEPSLKKLRNKIYDKFGLTPEDFRKKLEEHFTEVDPLTYADFADPSKILMINGSFDTIVNPEHSKELWKAMGKPDMIKIPTGHYSSFLFVAYTARKAKSHFKKTLDYKFSHADKESTTFK